MSESIGRGFDIYIEQGKDATSPSATATADNPANELMQAIVSSIKEKEKPRFEAVKPDMFDGCS